MKHWVKLVLICQDWINLKSNYKHSNNKRNINSKQPPNNLRMVEPYFQTIKTRSEFGAVELNAKCLSL